MSSPQDVRDMDFPALAARAAREGWSLRVTCSGGLWECAVYSRDAERIATGRAVDGTGHGDSMLDAMHAALTSVGHVGGVCPRCHDDTPVLGTYCEGCR